MYNKILVTGASGFVGTNMCNYLQTKGISYIGLNSNVDLRDHESTLSCFLDLDPDCVIHLAAICGGIGANMEQPAVFMEDNLRIGINIVRACNTVKVKKLINTGTICAYPKYCPVPFVEENLWRGYPEETNAPYGIAKKTIAELIVAYNKQFGLNGVNLFPTNMFGPHDNFDPKSSHVIPAIILKVYNAIIKGEDKVVLWGSGRVSRDFLYVEDFCEAVYLAMYKDVGPNPINIGTDEEYTIFTLSQMICKIMGFSGEVVFDKVNPDGQPRRRVHAGMAKSILNFTPKTKLDVGLQKTIDWFLNKMSAGEIL